MTTQMAITPQKQGLSAIISLAVDGLTNERSRRRYKLALEQFLGWYAGNEHRELSKRVVQSYKAHLQARDLAPSTINVALSAIRRLATEAADNGLLDEQTVAAVRRVRNVRSETIPAGREIAPGEIAGMMRVCADDPSPAGVRDAALIGLLYVTGVRRCEAVALDIADYTVDTGALTIRSGKGGRQRVVYITNGAADALADWLMVRGEEPGPMFGPVNKGGRLAIRRITPQAIRRMLEKRAMQAGIDDLTPHDFRRTAVGDLLDAGADLVIVQKIMGHSSPTTTARYDRRPEAAKRKAAGLLHVPYFQRGE